jgi:hypothetical protein
VILYFETIKTKVERKMGVCGFTYTQMNVSLIGRNMREECSCKNNNKREMNQNGIPMTHLSLNNIHYGCNDKYGPQ